MRWLAALIICSLFPVSALEAQFSGDLLSGNTDLAVILKPSYPTPGETVIASLDDYALGITGGTIDWYINDVLAPDGKNKREVSFTAGDAGSVDTLKAVLTLPSGIAMTASATMRPLYVDLIIEPQTYTPQFYPGRAIPTPESITRATVFMHDGNGPIDHSRHNYTWSIDGKALGGGTQRGAFQTLYTVPSGFDHVVTIRVTDPQGAVITERSIAVRSGEVDVRLHEVSPLYGLSFKPIGSRISFLSNTMSIRAIPYNLDVRVTPSNLFSEWRLDGQVVNRGSTDPFEITLERSGFGTTGLTYKLRHTEALLQGGQAGTLITF